MEAFYTFYKSPIGWLRIDASDIGLTAVEFYEERAAEDKLNGIVVEAAKQLKEYFNKERKAFDLPLEMNGTDFYKKVWLELVKIPYGVTTSYLALSRQLGDAKAIRAVGRANGRNPLAIIVPCHRVIGSDGSLTGYAGGLWRKQWLLQHEGALRQMELF